MKVDFTFTTDFMFELSSASYLSLIRSADASR